VGLRAETGRSRTGLRRLNGQHDCQVTWQAPLPHLFFRQFPDPLVELLFDHFHFMDQFIQPLFAGHDFALLKMNRARKGRQIMLLLAKWNCCNSDTQSDGMAMAALYKAGSAGHSPGSIALS
jgi:hypothetical protein